ncbi:hypothetical protein JD969_15120 [Planctomycetota bacterium]|nr:hypothetical protein JD969_15120 [Planctomycetota bacterium]
MQVIEEVILYTTGTPGSGKTFYRCARYLVDHVLPDTDMYFISNYPIGRVDEGTTHVPNYEGERYIDRIAKYVAKKTKKPEEEYLNRLEVIPEDELDKWKTGHSGPWLYFADREFEDVYLALDEIHEYCGRHHDAQHRKKWQNWISQIRHEGVGHFEFVTQSPEKVAKEMGWDTGIRMRVIGCGDLKDRLFGIKWLYWWELFAMISGHYIKTSLLLTQKKDDRTWRTIDVEKIKLDSFYFQFYDTHSKSGNKKQAKSAKKYEYQKRTKLGLLWWFIKKNLKPLSIRVFVLAVLWWLSFGGGVSWMMDTVHMRLYKVMGMEPPGKKEVLTPEQKVEREVSEKVDVKTKRMNATIESLKLQLEQESESRLEFEGYLRGLSQVMAIGEGYVVFRDGGLYSEGDLIETGYYDGKRIKAIEFKKRVCRLDDGTVLRLFGDRLRRSEEEAKQPQSRRSGIK